MWLLSKAKPSGKSTVISTGEKRKEHGNESDLNKRKKNVGDERIRSLGVSEQKQRTNRKRQSARKPRQIFFLFFLLLLNQLF
jgi:hypothetical protein